MAPETITRIAIDRRELDLITTIYNEHPEAYFATLVHTDSHNGIGTCLDLEVATKIKDKTVKVVYTITDEGNW